MVTHETRTPRWPRIGLILLGALCPFAPIAAQPPDVGDAVARHVALLDEALRAGRERQALDAMNLLRRRPKDPRVWKALVRALDRPHPVGTEAALHLGALGQPAAVPALVARTRSRSIEKDPRRLMAVLSALGAIGDGRGAPALLRALQHKNVAVAQAAVRGLGGLRARRHLAVERMIACLESLGSSLRSPTATTQRKRYEALSGGLVSSIGSLTGQAFTADTVAMRRWWKKNKRKVPDRLAPPRKPEESAKRKPSTRPRQDDA